MSYLNSEEATAQLKATLSIVLPELQWFSENGEVAAKISNAYALGRQWFPEVQITRRSYEDFARYVLAKVPSLTAGADEWELAAIQFFWAESCKDFLMIEASDGSMTISDGAEIIGAFNDNRETLWQRSLRSSRHLLDTQKLAKVLVTRYRLLRPRSLVRRRSLGGKSRSS